MNYLAPGAESEKRVKLLLELVGFRSEVLINAIHTHLVKGATISQASYIHDYDEDNLKRAIKKVNKVCSIVESIKQIDWEKINANKSK